MPQCKAIMLTQSHSGLIGPNCMGIYNMDPPATIAPNLILELPELRKGNIGVISHSGSLTGTFISRGQIAGPSRRWKV